MNNEKQINEVNKKIKELQAEVDLLSKSDVFDYWDLVPVNTPVIAGNGEARFFSSIGKYFCDARTSRKHHGEYSESNIKLDTEAENIYAYKPWFGGECPVADSQLVKLIFSDGKIKLCKANEWSWGKQHSMQIVLYSVIK